MKVETHVWFGVPHRHPGVRCWRLQYCGESEPISKKRSEIEKSILCDSRKDPTSALGLGTAVGAVLGRSQKRTCPAREVRRHSDTSVWYALSTTSMDWGARQRHYHYLVLITELYLQSMLITVVLAGFAQMLSAKHWTIVFFSGFIWLVSKGMRSDIRDVRKDQLNICPPCPQASSSS